MRLLAEIMLLVVAGVGIAVCLALVPRPAPRLAKPPPAPPPQRPDQLLGLERRVVSATANALHVHASLRPVLVEIAARRLAARGQTLERMPAAVGRDLLSDQLWELVRPDRPFPEDRHGPGVTVDELAAMLDVLERL